MDHLKTNINRWLPVVIVMAIIFYVSGDYNPYRWLPSSWFDNASSGGLSTGDVGHLGHFLEYTLLGLAVLRAVVWRDEITVWLIVVSVGISLLYALSDEFHQIFVPERTFQIQDLLVDAGGITVGTFVQYLRSRLKKKHKE